MSGRPSEVSGEVSGTSSPCRPPLPGKTACSARFPGVLDSSLARRMLNRGRGGGRLSERGPRSRAAGRNRGFSLSELLAVVALIGIAIAIGIPIVNEQVRMAEVRAVADDLAMHLRAARTIAVTKHTTIPFAIDVDPINQFRYAGNDGVEKAIKMPGRVRIAGD